MLLTQSSTSSADPVCRQVSTALVLTEMKRRKNVVSCFELNPTQDRASTYEKVAAHCLRIGKGSFLRFCRSTHHPLLLTKPNQCEYTSQLPLEEEKDFRIIRCASISSTYPCLSVRPSVGNAFEFPFYQRPWLLYVKS